MANINWLSIKNDYITSNPKIAYKDLSKKYGVSISSIEKKAAEEKWRELRNENCRNIETSVQEKTSEKIISLEVNRIEKLLESSDKAQVQIDLALGQLNKRVDMFGNVHDCEVIDVSRLKKLTTALKEIRDILKDDTNTDESKRQVQSHSALIDAIKQYDADN